MIVVVAGRLLSPRWADYMVAEPPARRRMRRSAAIVVGVVVALTVLTVADLAAARLDRRPALDALATSVAGLVWMVRIIRGPRDEPLFWRYRDN